MIEAFNKTLTDAIAHLIDEEGGDWEDNLAWARRAYLSAPHDAISSGTMPLTHIEAYRGWKCKFLLDINVDDATLNSPIARSQNFYDNVNRAQEWIRSHRIDYEAKMEATRRNVNRRDRKFKAGDLVSLYRKPKSKRAGKTDRTYSGPYQVIEVIMNDDVISEYLLQRIGQEADTFRAHIEQLRKYVEPEEVKSNRTPEEIEDLIRNASTKKFDVEKVIAERGERNKNKEYLIRWKNHTSEHDSWTPEHLIDAPKLIDEFNKRRNSLCYVNRHENASRIEATITRNIMSLDHPTAISDICREFDLDPSQVITIWASPPCQTFSPIDPSNLSPYRDHFDPTKPPTKTDPEKAKVALEHDQLVQHITQIMAHHKRNYPHTFNVIENPDGSLQRRPYMHPENLPLPLRKVTVDQCNNYDRPFRKTTNLFHDSHWVPHGKSGDGRCHFECGQGQWVNGRYTHNKALGMQSIRKPKGPGAIKVRNAVAPFNTARRVSHRSFTCFP